MKARWFAAGAVLGVLATVVVHAQTKQDLQMQQDLRMLQEQVSLLKSAVAALTDQTKATQKQIEADAQVRVKSHADEMDAIRKEKEQVDTFSTKLDTYATEVKKFGGDLPSVRQGLDQQQQTLAKLLQYISSPVPTPAANSATGAPLQPGTPLPPLPSALYLQAWNNYGSAQWRLAIDGFTEFLKQPGSELRADEAQYWIGMSYLKWAKYSDAQTAFQKLIDTYPSSGQLPDAYFSLGESLGAMGKKADANNAYGQAYKLAPDSSAGLQAKQRLGIKG